MRPLKHCWRAAGQAQRRTWRLCIAAQPIESWPGAGRCAFGHGPPSSHPLQSKVWLPVLHTCASLEANSGSPEAGGMLSSPGNPPTFSPCRTFPLSGRSCTYQRSAPCEMGYALHMGEEGAPQRNLDLSSHGLASSAANRGFHKKNTAGVPEHCRQGGTGQPTRQQRSARGHTACRRS